jgi:anti-sigma factor RsiW
MTSGTPIGDDDLQAYVDDRLTAERRAEVEAYLADQPDLARRVGLEQAQRKALRCQLQAKFDEPIPTRLRVANIRAAQRLGWTGRLRIAAGVVVIFALGSTSGWLVRGTTPATETPATVRVADDAVSAYRTYVVEVAHPVEVGPQSQDHLVRWLSRRLGRPLSAPDLTGFGYQLMGGRLLPAGEGVAAQFMYEDDSGKRLTVYVRTGGDGATAFRFFQKGDVLTLAWLDQDFDCAVSAAVDRSKLQQVAEAVYHTLDKDS